ncbi:MAG: hypothetical protein ABIP79_04400 [Chitinophagaceae bacterium]
MKNILQLFILLFLCTASYSQVVTFYKANVELYEHANYTGQSRSYGPGQYVLSDFNDMTSSIKVPAGMVAVIYEHATATLGYGIWVDLLEDCLDLSVYNFNDKVSYINIFYATKDNMYDWKRNTMMNGQFVAGHWERKRAKPLPPDMVAVVAPAIAGPVSTAATILSVNGATTTISTLGPVSSEGIENWNTSQKQMGVIGNDFRGPEYIGTACFQRASNNFAIPDNINFWYPQNDSRDHRGISKKTLSGTVVRAGQVNIQGTFADFDVNIDIKPLPDYMYLLTKAKPRHYTTIMSMQYQASKISVGNILTKPIWTWESSSGQPDCDDEKSIDKFTFLEAEIAEDYWPKGNNKFGRARLTDMALIRTGKQICVYGPWIYDEGHCRHPEIHPAEELWWQDTINNKKQYNLNVVCDASRRFFWRKQMDDGTKLKPWAEPPVKGMFAIAFEYVLPKTETVINFPVKQFEADYIQHYNLTEYPNANQTYSLVYQGKTIVTFKPNNSSFKVSFEQVGLAPDDSGKIRGFLVLETQVGKLTQIATEITVLNGTLPQVLKLPANSTPDKAPQLYEDLFFKKEEGHYYFTVTETTVSSDRPAGSFERIGKTN